MSELFTLTLFISVFMYSDCTVLGQDSLSSDQWNRRTMVNGIMSRCVCSIWKTWSIFVALTVRRCIEWSLTVVLVWVAVGQTALTACGTMLMPHCLSHETSASRLYMVLWHCSYQWTSHAMSTSSLLLARLHASDCFIYLAAAELCDVFVCWPAVKIFHAECGIDWLHLTLVFRPRLWSSRKCIYFAIENFRKSLAQYSILVSEHRMWFTLGF